MGDGVAIIILLILSLAAVIKAYLALWHPDSDVRARAGFFAVFVSIWAAGGLHIATLDHMRECAPARIGMSDIVEEP